MFDQAAAQSAAAAVLASAPRIEGGSGTELAISVKELVTAIVTAGNPDALVIPAYDEALAPNSAYRIEPDTEANPGATMGVQAHPGAVSMPVRAGDGTMLTAGMTGPDFAWNLGLALCAAAQEARRRATTEVQS